MKKLQCHEQFYGKYDKIQFLQQLPQQCFFNQGFRFPSDQLARFFVHPSRFVSLSNKNRTQENKIKRKQVSQHTVRFQRSLRICLRRQRLAGLVYGKQAG